jgi:hypothetical protein
MNIRIALLSLLALNAHAVETLLTDSAGQKSYLYTPSEQPVEGKARSMGVPNLGAFEPQ